MLGASHKVVGGVQRQYVSLKARVVLRVGLFIARMYISFLSYFCHTGTHKIICLPNMFECFAHVAVSLSLIFCIPVRGFALVPLDVCSHSRCEETHQAVTHAPRTRSREARLCPHRSFPDLHRLGSDEVARHHTPTPGGVTFRRNESAAATRASNEESSLVDEVESFEVFQLREARAFIFARLRMASLLLVCLVFSIFLASTAAAAAAAGGIYLTGLAVRSSWGGGYSLSVVSVHILAFRGTQRGPWLSCVVGTGKDDAVCIGSTVTEHVDWLWLMLLPRSIGVVEAWRGDAVRVASRRTIIYTHEQVDLLVSSYFPLRETIWYGSTEHRARTSIYRNVGPACCYDRARRHAPCRKNQLPYLVISVFRGGESGHQLVQARERVPRALHAAARRT